MKKLIYYVGSMVIVASLSGCGSNSQSREVVGSAVTQSATQNQGQQENQEQISEATQEATAEQSQEATTEVNQEVSASESVENTLIVYFSRVGNTDFPEDIDVVSSASLMSVGGELVGSTEYVANIIRDAIGGDVHLVQTVNKYPVEYRATTDLAKVEMGTYPELVPSDLNIEQYDHIFFGYPNWWAEMPMAMFSFLEAYDLDGKNIYPFCTHGGSRLSNTVRTLREWLPNSVVEDGLAIANGSVSSSQDMVEQWIGTLGIE